MNLLSLLPWTKEISSLACLQQLEWVNDLLAEKMSGCTSKALQMERKNQPVESCSKAEEAE